MGIAATIRCGCRGGKSYPFLPPDGWDGGVALYLVFPLRTVLGHLRFTRELSLKLLVVPGPSRAPCFPSCRAWKPFSSSSLHPFLRIIPISSHRRRTFSRAGGQSVTPFSIRQFAE
jgi:hypothetical protein